ncbi:hypothetical protein C4Z29_028155 [Klebsiella quasipneumoniae subsp. quasipneumoniae]|nr:hypothetical protein C4Z29_028155 [Klebsiella quasipneumoniae subsp. quasipneumoniae]
MIKQSENCGAMGNFAPINRRAQCTITGSGKAAYRDKKPLTLRLNQFKANVLSQAARIRAPVV